MKQHKTCLIIGGTSGLGLVLARQLADEYHVIVTGRTDPQIGGLEFYQLELGKTEDITGFVASLPTISFLIDAAGYFQEGAVGDITDVDIIKVVNVTLLAPMLIVRELLVKQGTLDEFIAISSTSQWKPRLDEPIYTAAKAGLGMFSNSLALDPNVGKVMVFAPGGMNTPFWRDTDKDTSSWLDPKMVARELLELRNLTYEYLCVKLPRDAAKAEVIERR
jgi:NAD(P)-dependent dehydrogenase (short-subunit alcohol dehydrogenase family)